MGTKVAVASVVYNLAGPERKRPDFLKSLILGGVLKDADSLGEVIATGYRNGPGVRLRNFLRWTLSNADFQDNIGITSGELSLPPELDLADVEAALPVVAGQTNRVEFAELGSADWFYWAKQYVAANHPDLLNTNWKADYDETTNQITITYEDLTEETFVAADYDQDARYLYVGYTPVNDPEEEPVESGSWLPLPYGVDFPDMSGWTEDYNYHTETSVPVNTTYETEITYSDGRPMETGSVTIPSTANFIELTADYHKEEFQGFDWVTQEFYSIRTFRNHVQSADATELTDTTVTEEIIDGGVTKITKVKKTWDSLRILRNYRVSTQRIVHRGWEDPVIFIYKEGGGNAALNALFNTPVTEGSFFPPIPFRYKNDAVTDTPTKWKVTLPFTPAFGQMLSFATDIDSIDTFRKGIVTDVDDGTGLTTVENYGKSWLADVLDGATDPVVKKEASFSDPTPAWEAMAAAAVPQVSPYADIYPICKRAFRKALDANFDDALDSINENESIGDIDYAYATFGVSLNVEEWACRKYVYKFFQRMKGLDGYVSDEARATAEEDWWTQWNAAYLARNNHDYWVSQLTTSSGYTEQDEPPAYPTVPWRTISVDSKHTGISDYRTKLTWAFISEETGSGILKEGAKKGELWFEVMDDPVQDVSIIDEYLGDTPHLRQLNNKIRLCWQDSENTWRRLTITGLYFNNYIYKSRSVEITAKEALEDEDDSGFIVPLHETVYLDMSMKDRTQMATACCLLVFNCYQEVEQPWYTEGWFKVLAIVVVIVVSITLALLTGGASAGLLGSASSVGAALGASGTTAIIVGAAVNAIAGMVAGLIITEAATALFGEKVGVVVGAIAGTVLTLGLADPSQFWDALTSPQGLFAIGTATTNGTAAYLQASTEELARKTQELMEKSSEKLAELQKRYEEEFGAGGAIDLELVTKYVSELTESSEQFLARTLMTGSDIVELNLSFLHNFSELTLQTDLP